VPPVSLLRYEVVPLPDVTSADPDRVPRYQVVPVDEEGPVRDPSRQVRMLEEEFGRPGVDAAPPPDSAARRRSRDERDDRYGEEERRRKPRRRRRRRELWKYETSWFECLAFPLRASPLIAWLAGAFTLLAGAGALELPKFPDLEPGERWLWFVWLLLPFLVLGYIAGFWHCVLSSAITGEAGLVRWPGKDLRLVVEGLWRFLVCFAAGPALLLVAGYLFWLHAGDMKLVDWLILLELGIAETAYWLFAVVAVAEGDSVRYVTPVNIVRTVSRLRGRAVIAGLLFPVIVGLHGLWGLDALAEVHRQNAAGWFSLWCCTVSAMACITFLMRWLGVSSFLSRVNALAPLPRPRGEAPDGT